MLDDATGSRDACCHVRYYALHGMTMHAIIQPHGGRLDLGGADI